MGRKLFLYNVTVGLYAMDWWERYLFSILRPCLVQLQLPDSSQIQLESNQTVQLHKKNGAE